MRSSILYCRKCNSFTLGFTCCGIKTTNPLPPKYSPEDKYGKYRRMLKENSL